MILCQAAHRTDFYWLAKHANKKPTKQRMSSLSAVLKATSASTIHHDDFSAHKTLRKHPLDDFHDYDELSDDDEDTHMTEPLE